MTESPLPSRSELINKTAVMNQMRNAVYHLMRFLKSKNVKDMKSELLEMGRNLGSSYFKAWNISQTRLENDLKIIYETTIHSKISIRFLENNQMVEITDEKCPLCKYKYEDIDTAGCFVIMGMVESIMKELGYKIFEALNVSESKTNGDSVCRHLYKLK